MKTLRQWVNHHQIGVAFVILILLPGMFLPSFAARTKSSCPPKEPATWHIEGNEYSARNKRDPKHAKYTAVQAKEKAHGGQRGAERSNSDVLEHWFCEEAKFTDVALVVFTYFLVVVGGLTMWAVDTTAKRTERAYIFCSGVFGKLNDGVDTLVQDYRPKASNYGKPWMIVIENYGRTQGVITKIQYATLWKKDFMAYGDMLVSDILKDEKLKRRVKVRTVHDIFAGKCGPLRYRYVQPGRYIGTVFFGRIDYLDVFGEPHHSTFALLHRKEHTDTFGPSYARDHS